MFDYLISIEYEDYQLDPERHHQLALQMNIIWNNLGEEGLMQFIPVLRSSIERYTQTRLKIDATETKEFFNAKDTDYLIAQKSWRPFKPVEISLLRDERKEQAIDEYLKTRNVTVIPIEQYGILINGSIPFFCCAPDYVIRRNAEEFLYFVEVHCPSQYNKEGEDSYYIDERDDTLHIKHSHEYYFEIMATIAILNVDFCDFLVWNTWGEGLGALRVERIYRDELLISCLISKLSNVQKNLIIEYLKMRDPRDSKLFNIY